MTARPILFSAPMIRAILEGRKSQTRRIVTKQPALNALSVFGSSMLTQPGCADLLPYATGDELWVREAFSGPYSVTGIAPRKWSMESEVWYWADGNPPDGDWTPPKPSIHMPRWASRITLRVTGVKVERLQDISEDDAKAEGVTALRVADLVASGELKGVVVATDDPMMIYENPADPAAGWKYARQAFRDLWMTINGAASWEANPWVAAISFERIKP